MKESRTRNIMAMITLDEKLVTNSGVAVFVVENKKSQEELASELGRILGGNVYGLANGVIIITET
ncbi:hypothetical protein QBE52_14430 [Clostridiaceae bacterium 35-E11]